jgi:hypothetical protein
LARNAASLRLVRTSGRPAFDSLELDETEDDQASEFQIQSKTMRDLGNRTGTVELRGKLRFFHAKLESFHTLTTMARVSWNPAHIIIRFVDKIFHFDEAQSA